MVLPTGNRRRCIPAGAEPVEVDPVRKLRSDDGYIPALSLVAEDARYARPFEEL